MLKRSWNRTCKRQLSCSEFAGASLTKTNRGECLKKAEFEFSRDRLMRSDFLRWLYELVDCSAFYGRFAEEVGSVAFRMMSSAEFIIRNSSKSYPLLWIVELKNWVLGSDDSDGSFSGAGVWAAATVCRSRKTLHSHFKVWLNQMHIQDALNDAKRFKSRAPEVAGSD